MKVKGGAALGFLHGRSAAALAPAGPDAIPDCARALNHRDFRPVLDRGQSVSSVGSWMQSVGLSWLSWSSPIPFAWAW